METITYASLDSLDESVHSAFEAALDTVQSKLGRTYPLLINHAPLTSPEQFTDINPASPKTVLGRFQCATPAQVEEAVRLAHQAFLSPWRHTPWPRRIELLRNAAALLTARQHELGALLVLEVGKNRGEAMAEVTETIELILYYCSQYEENRGYVLPLAETGSEHTSSVLKPYGVWAVVAPFNFPLALSAGMATGALAGGNTVVFKPSSDTPLAGYWLAEIFQQAGLPKGVFQYVTGPGSTVGEALLENPLVAGFCFTGSKKVGMDIRRRFTRLSGKPCLAEMGGKNPAIILPSASLEDAAEGVMRSAFSMGGQKCSACSRVYLHESIYQDYLDLLLEKSSHITIGNPVGRDIFLGPLINQAAQDRHERMARLARKTGRILGTVPHEQPPGSGFYVSPLVVDKLPHDSILLEEELFSPLLILVSIQSLEEGLRLSNNSEYGLTAGIFSQDPLELEEFLQEMEAGVLYCNRRNGATTGSWPGVQSFGGWKNSGTTGKNALGPHYLPQFLREQSQTRVAP